MKSMGSYFSISIPLVKENLRRFWAISAIGFLAYFLTAVFPILMSYDHIGDMASYITTTLTNFNPFIMAIHLLLPVVTAVIVFRYLQNSSSVTAMHTMPFTRATLFNSGVLSGLILSLGPLVLNGIILLCIAKPSYNEMMFNTDMAVNVFARPAILLWIWQSFIIILSIYGISVFAGIVTGNSIIHLCAAFAFNFLAPGLYSIFILYCDTFLFGYSPMSDWWEITLSISPFLKTFNVDGTFPLWATLYYIISALAILGISSLLYHKRKLERASESFVFGFLTPIISYLIAFLGMTLVGFYFQIFGRSELYMYAGFAGGAVIFFIIGRMIVLKTPRVFNMPSLKNFGIYAVIATLFITSLSLDLTGFEKRVPDPADVKTAGVDAFFNSFSDMESRNSGESRYSSSLFKNWGDPNYIQGESLVYKDPADIKALTMLHQNIVDNKKEISAAYQGLFIQNPVFSYDTGLERCYSLPYSFLDGNKNMAALYESKTLKDFYSLNNLNYEMLTCISVENALFSGYFSINISDAKDIRQLFDALEQDFQEMTYGEFLSPVHPYGFAVISYKCKEANQSELSTKAMSVAIRLTDEHTISWLREHGYAPALEVTPDDVASISFAHFTRRPDDGISDNVYSNGSKKEVIITDKVQINEILTSYECYRNYDERYDGIITFTPEALQKFLSGSDIRYEVPTAEIYGLDSNICFSAETAPDFIKSK